MSNSSFEKNGSDWYSDRYDALRVERNRYFFLLIVCAVALIMSITANVMLSPLKTAVPYLIEINKEDGSTTVVKPLDFKSLEEKQTVTLYFLYKYLNARMNYNYGLRQVQADTVRALSNAPVYQTYASQVDVSNEKSPTRQYQNNGIISTKITSYSFPYKNIAQIHFYTELNNSNSDHASVRQYWLATIKFTYSKAALPTNDKVNINPVGFFVTDFQITQEIPTGVNS